MEQMSYATAKTARDGVSAIEQVRSEVTHQVKKLKEDFIAILEELEASIISQVETITTEDRNDLERLQKELVVSKDIESLQSDIQSPFTSKRL